MEESMNLTKDIGMNEYSPCVLKASRFYSNGFNQPNNIRRRFQNYVYYPVRWVRAMAQAVSRPFKTVALVRSQAIPCGICGGKRRLDQVFL
jgi:hypothetical protein